jgi:formylglycine-generating enzyme required for sulfatase activity
VFALGSEDRWAYPGDGESPVREVEVPPFSIGAYAVSNADFADFVQESGLRSSPRPCSGASSTPSSPYRWARSR